MEIPVSKSRKERLDILAHDVNECLHVIAMATTILKSSPNDQTQLEYVCESLDRERRKAADLVQQLLVTAHESD